MNRIIEHRIPFIHSGHHTLVFYLLNQITFEIKSIFLLVPEIHFIARVCRVEIKRLSLTGPHFTGCYLITLI